jgi:hypothetical protein
MKFAILNKIQINVKQLIMMKNNNNYYFNRYIKNCYSTMIIVLIGKTDLNKMSNFV